MAAAFAIDLLKEEFSAGDIESKIRASSHLHSIGTVLGPERTCSELLPTLTELVGNWREADEVLYVLSKSALQLIDSVGSNYVPLCALFEILSVVEETTVRERAVRGLQQICTRMTPTQAWQELYPLMKRLAEAEWFTPRRSACGLLSHIYCQVDASHRAELLELLKTLVADETPMVRRTVATAMAGMALAPNGGASIALEHLVPVWMSLSEDPHFSVRVAAVNVTGALVQAVGKDAALQEIVPHCQKLAASRGWRVRNALAAQLGPICQNLPGSASSAPVLSMLTLLLRDYEDEVTESALNQLGTVARAIARDEGNAGLKVFMDALLPVLQPGAESFKLRRALAKASLAMAETAPTVLGARLATPVWEVLFADTTSKDASDVIRVLSEGLGHILASLDTFSFTERWGKLVLKLYESSKSKAVDELNAQIAAATQNSQQQQPNQEGLPGDPVETPKWRIRVNVLANLPLLIKADKQTAVQLWLSALSDETFEVRAFAGSVLNNLPPALVKQELGPMLIQFFKRAQASQTYQHRIAVVKAAAGLKNEDVFAVLQPVYAEALRDPVNNVQVAALLAAAQNAIVAKQCKEEITALLSSTVPDVSGFAKAALAAATI